MHVFSVVTPCSEQQAGGLQVTIALLKNAMIKSSSDLFLVDGFPRALDQAEIFERDIMPCQLVSSLALVLLTNLHLSLRHAIATLAQAAHIASVTLLFLQHTAVKTQQLVPARPH